VGDFFYHRGQLDARKTKNSSATRRARPDVQQAQALVPKTRACAAARAQQRIGNSAKLAQALYNRRIVFPHWCSISAPIQASRPQPGDR